MNTRTAAPRPNTYAGTCAKCYRYVAAGAGILGPKVDGRWTVRHTDCEAARTPTTVRPLPQGTVVAAPAPTPSTGWSKYSTGYRPTTGTAHCNGCGARTSRFGECDECGVMG